ncbi:glutathione-dependent disulfide-bond oxidoreductase [Rhodobacteraceae bacterium nBUS_22]
MTQSIKEMTMPYVPPKRWIWDQENGGKFSNINRPISGSTHEQPLPRGEHPLQLYSQGTPNGVKATVMLEELLELGHEGAEYDAWMIKIDDGHQFGNGFVELNPNSKIPALLDTTNSQRIFESGSILFYLAEKFNRFLPLDVSLRTETINWLFWLQGSAPYLGGGFGHFYAYAPEKFEYAINRYSMEAKRQLDVLDRNLSTRRYLVGDVYTIADIATAPWYGALVKGYLYGAADFLDVTIYTNVNRWADEIFERPAYKRGRMVNRTGDPSNSLYGRHNASDFATTNPTISKV